MLTVKFIFERETAGAVRYQEVDAKGKALDIKEGAKIGTLYIRKTALPKGKIPQELSLTITILHKKVPTIKPPCGGQVKILGEDHLLVGDAQ